LLVSSVAALLVGSVLTACGGSDSSGSGGSAPEGDAINIGFICACSGSQAASLSHTKLVAEAWEKSINDGGGLGGVPVNVIYKDDGLDPAKSLQLVKELVEKDKVMAIVGNATVVDSSWADYVTEKKIPVVGGLNINGPVASNPNFFGTGASLAMTLFFTTKMAAEDGSKKIGVGFCAESPLCVSLGDLVAPMAEAYGATTQAVKVDASAPNYTAQCLAWEKDDVDTIMVLTDANVAKRFIDDCAKQGFKPKVISPASSASNAWLSSPNLDGVVMPSAEALQTDTSIPGIKEFHAVLDKYASDVLSGDTFGITDLETWTGFKLFETIATNAKLTATSTPADVTAALYALKGETLEGMTAPITYTAGQPTFIPCAFLQQIKDGKYESYEGTAPICLDEAEVGVFTKAVGG
jgi:branched-chain amino acid transport system substrate-binding protein